MNCGHPIDGHYCSNCGQKATVKRLTAFILFEDILHFFTHLEKGFFFTIWNFLKKPGISSLNYLKGKRKRYQSPVSYFLICTGLYILVHNLIINHFHYRLSDENFAQLNVREQANALLREHFTVIIIPLLLISAVLIYVILSRPRYNFIEVLTLCLYGGGTFFAMLFLSDIVLGIVFRMNTITTYIFLWQTILSTAYNTWYYYDFYKNDHLHFFWLRLVSVAVLVSLIGWAILEFLPVAWIYITG